MIYSSIYANDDISKYPEAIQKALNYCKTTDIAALEPGTYPIEGDMIYAKVFDNTAKPVADTHSEFHNKYVDVQFFVTGGELMGYAPKKKEDVILCGQNPDDDVYFTDEVEGEQFIKLIPGDYIMLFPNDLHRPGVADAADGEPKSYRKAVVKVAVAAL